MFALDFYFEKSQKYAKNQNVECKHVSIIHKNYLFQNYYLSLGHFYFLAEYLSDFFCCSDNTLEDEFWYHDATFDDVFIDIPEPSRVHHFYTANFCDKYVFCVEKPLSPMFWVAGWSRVWYFPGLNIADEY